MNDRERRALAAELNDALSYGQGPVSLTPELAANILAALQPPEREPDGWTEDEAHYLVREAYPVPVLPKQNEGFTVPVYFGSPPPEKPSEPTEPRLWLVEVEGVDNILYIDHPEDVENFSRSPHHYTVTPLYEHPPQKEGGES